ncbi:WD40 repeat [Kalmanozyma brasiliensis GHG001]|uniref:WD40 repeat n=1 Tax=Kalmanozyma brasiliensis (strain GHG001) TaxID=1365824 RepID=UPI001CE90500|nr:WD40 repeat [Kalmanozyma brasiliensis GHG001]EST07308.2 WD40 repeat [Kalmanozyma brasiliensis GHG001]
MADAPFDLPGHYWDSDKKRFFKILSGQSDAAPGSSSASDKARASKSKKKEDEETAKRVRHFASTPLLPAIQPANIALKSANDPCKAVSDPVSLRQQGRTSLTASQAGARSRIEGAYSHLALCTAKRPLRNCSDRPEIVGLQTDVGGHALFVLDLKWIVRILPTSEYTPVVFHCYHGLTPSSMWRSSRMLWFGLSLVQDSETEDSETDGPRNDDVQRGIACLPMPEARVREEEDQNSDDSQPRDSIVQVSLYENPISSHGSHSWTFFEIEDSLEGDIRIDDDVDDGANQERRRSSVFIAIAQPKGIVIRRLVSDWPGEDYDDSCTITIPFDSDVMACAFDPSGEVLYCGTRSGHVLFWRHFTTHFLRNEKCFVGWPIDGEGSITNLSIVSSTEMLVVRIHGGVQLIDLTTGQVKRRYEGHINSYSYSLGFAVDKDLRLLALAGLDRRVRIWSLDSPLPLGTSANGLAPIYHPPEIHRPGQSPDTLYDESLDETFTRRHAATDGRPAITRGSTLSSIVFPEDVSVLHWHPRYRYEGCDLYEVQAMREAQSECYGPSEQRWMDLYVGVGEWLYQFRFP